MTIAGEQAIQVLGCFEALGLCSEDVCARVGLAPSSLAAPGTRISRVLFESLFLAAAELRGDALVGLRAGMAKAPADLLFFVSLSQANIGDAIREWARLSRAVVDDSVTAGLVVRGDSAWFWAAGSVEISTEALRHVSEQFAGQIVQYLALATGGACRPTMVRFPHAPAGPIDEYERILGVPVTFRHKTLEIHLRASDLTMPIATANAEIARLMQQTAEQQIRAAEGRAFRSRVELAIRRCVREAASHSKESVAALLAVSVSTLQRRLGEEGCSFRGVRDEVRRSVAEELLAHSDRNVSEVALALDFADVAAFGKAFRRWTATSPREFRASKRQG